MKDITEMARKAGFADSDGVVHAAYQLQHFADLVSVAEREACAKVCDEATLRFHALWEKFEYLEDQAMSIAASQCAAAIRERRDT